MIEISPITFFTEDIQRFWRSYNIPCERRKIEIEENDYAYRAKEVLQIQTADGNWIDAEPAFREIIEVRLKGLMLDVIDKPTVYNYINKKR